jgi:hypothetical protein
MADTDSPLVQTGQGTIPTTDEEAEERRRSANVFDERRRRLTALLAWSGLGLFFVGGSFVVQAFFSGSSSATNSLLPFIFIAGIVSMAAVLLLVRRGQIAVVPIV